MSAFLFLSLNLFWVSHFFNLHLTQSLFLWRLHIFCHSLVVCVLHFQPTDGFKVAHKPGVIFMFTSGLRVQVCHWELHLVSESVFKTMHYCVLIIFNSYLLQCFFVPRGTLIAHILDVTLCRGSRGLMVAGSSLGKKKKKSRCCLERELTKFRNSFYGWLCSILMSAQFVIS